MLLEKRKGMHGEEIFEQKSYYYYADVGDNISVTNLFGYEKKMGFALEWADIEAAYKINTELAKNYNTPFLHSETYMLEYLKEVIV